MTATMWRVVKFVSHNTAEESIETVPSSWIRDDEEICYWPPFSNKKDLEKAIKSAWSPNLNWKKYNVKIISKECHQFKVASAKASKALFCSDVDSNTDTELPDKRQRKLNKRKFSSSNEEEEESDEGSNYPVPPNSNTNNTLHGGDSSKSVCLTPSRTYSEKQSQRFQIDILNKFATSGSPVNKKQGYVEETSVGSDLTSASKRSRHLDSPCLSINTVHSERSNLGPDGISTFIEHPTSSCRVQELVTNNPADSKIQSLESKVDYFIKLAMMNNRLVKEQQKTLDIIDGKLNQLLNRGTEVGLPIRNQTFGVDDEKMFEFKKKNPLSTEDDFDKLEEILLSESNEFKDCVVRFLSLGGSNQYKEAVRRIMASVLTDQVSILYSYRGHKGKKVFHTKELAKLIIKAVQLCEKTGRTILNKDIELEISIWLSKSKERHNKKH